MSEYQRIVVHTDQTEPGCFNCAECPLPVSLRGINKLRVAMIEQCRDGGRDLTLGGKSKAVEGETCRARFQIVAETVVGKGETEKGGRKRHSFPRKGIE